MEDAENEFNDAITKMQSALEIVREEGGGAMNLRTEIGELEEREGELQTAAEEINGEFKAELKILEDYHECKISHLKKLSSLDKSFYLV